MSYNPILIVGGEPNSVFTEILFKTLKFKNSIAHSSYLFRKNFKKANEKIKF